MFHETTKLIMVSLSKLGGVKGGWAHIYAGNYYIAKKWLTENPYFYLFITRTF